MVKIITEREREIIKKKIDNRSLTQNESNILSKSIRTKLKEISKINTEELLNKLEYNQEARSIEKRIKEIVLRNVSQVVAIIICGSAIQTNYKEYNDIDVIIAIRVAIKSKKKKRELIEKLENAGKDKSLNLDIQIYAKDSILKQYPSDPSLIYQLKDSKIIYGKLKIPKKIELYNINLKMKLDWSDVQDNSPQEIYKSLRNAILVKLLLKKIVDNKILKMEIEKEIGRKTINNLKNNKASVEEKRLAKLRLKNLIEELENDLQGELWEKRVQLTV